MAMENQPSVERVIIYEKGADRCKKQLMPTGDAEQKYCEIYETMPAIKNPLNPDLGKMFLDGVKKGVELYGSSVCHGVLICGTQHLLAYGNDAFIGVVYGCVACTGLVFEGM